MVVDDDAGLHREGLDALLRLVGTRHCFFQPKFSAQRLAHQFCDAFCPPPLILFLGEFALNEDGIERHAIGRCEDLGARNVRASRRAGSRDEGQETRMIGSVDGELGYGRERIGLEAGHNALGRGAIYQRGVFQLLLSGAS